MKNELKVIKEEDRDSWYKLMSNRIPINPNEEPLVGLMEWVDLIVEYRNQ